MQTKITVELVHEGEMPSFAAEVLNETINGGGLDPSDIMAWLAKYVVNDPAWDFKVTLEEDGNATE